MGQTLHIKNTAAVALESKPLLECVKFTKEMDRRCFPKEMLLGAEEFELLIAHNAEATILTYNDVRIGQAITLPETAAAIILDGVDADFHIHHDGVYSYSEAILPEYQNQGFGSLLLQAIACRMSNLGYTSISAHVRTRNGWDKKRSRTLPVAKTRLISDFWEDPREVVQYQHVPL